MKYQWTDWITHVPGQRLPIGTHGLFEEKNRHGNLSQREGTIRRSTFEAANWDMADEFGTHTMITRYKLRSIAEEAEQVSERELDLVE
jgi:hypothetical protein